MRQAWTVHVPWPALLLPVFLLFYGAVLFLTAEEGARQSRAINGRFLGRAWAEQMYTKRTMRIQGIIFAALGLIGALVIVVVNIVGALR